jgi:autotransporter-associated beta strand protein
VITGPGRFAKAGAGTLVLSAASDFTGDTEIQAGTLVLGNSGSIAASRGVFLSSPTAQLDATPAGGLVIGAVKGVGGVGTITGGLTLASGAVLVVDRDAVVGGLPLTVSGTVSLPDTFSLTSLFGLNGEVLDLSLFPEGRFTLIANASDFSNIGDWGPTKKVDIGDGRSAYFDTGSLVLVVVPEPGAVVIAAVGLAGLAWRVRRRARRSCEQDWDATLFLIES